MGSLLFEECPFDRKECAATQKISTRSSMVAFTSCLPRRRSSLIAAVGDTLPGMCASQPTGTRDRKFLQRSGKCFAAQSANRGGFTRETGRRQPRGFPRGRLGDVSADIAPDVRIGHRSCNDALEVITTALQLRCCRFTFGCPFVMRSILLFLGPCLLAGTMSGAVSAQTDAIKSRLKPLGVASAVDQFRRGRSSLQNAGRAEPSKDVRFAASRVQPALGSVTQAAHTGRRNPVQQTVWMQSQFQAPPLDGGGMSLPSENPSTSPSPPAAAPPAAAPPGAAPSGALPDSVPFPQASQPPASAPEPTPPRSLPTPSAGNVAGGYSSDLTPMSPPQLSSGGYATMDNCRLISGPTPYMAASVLGSGCGQVVPTSYAPVNCPPVATAPPAVGLPAEIPSAATIPPVSVFPPVAQAVTAAPARSLITFGQERNVVQVGQGLWGQPVAYVPGQSFRNWLRYFSP